jgi:integrase/recombinase XerD
MLDELFKRFVKEKTFLANVSPKTVRFYQQSYKAFKRTVGEQLPDRLMLTDFIVKSREAGMSAGCINVYIRGMNSFLSWLWENKLTGEKLRMKELKQEQKVIPTYNEVQIKALLSFKPKKPSEHRTYALICLLLDTGVRIEECLTLTRENVDLDNLLIKVRGKGNKERFLPISLECRKVLYRFLQRHNCSLVFCAKGGTRWAYRNAFRDLTILCKKVGIEEGTFHKFRHTFATEYLRNGGGELYLQRTLGHTTLQMTRRYAQISEEDLKRVHAKTSILSRLR